MKILLTGASGFIGSRLREALLDAGHELLCVARTPRADAPRCRWLALDLGVDAAPRSHAALAGVDAVVNAAGMFRPHGVAGFDAVHTRGPIALFDACAARGVRRVGRPTRAPRRCRRCTSATCASGRRSACRRSSRWWWCSG